MANGGVRCYIFHKCQHFNRNLSDTQGPWPNWLPSVVDTHMFQYNVHSPLLSKCWPYARTECLCAGHLCWDSYIPHLSLSHFHSCIYCCLHVWLLLALWFNLVSFSMHMTENALARAPQVTCTLLRPAVLETRFSVLGQRFLLAQLW